MKNYISGVMAGGPAFPEGIVDPVRQGLRGPVKIAAFPGAVYHVFRKNMRPFMPVFDRGIFKDEILVVPDKLVIERIQVGKKRR